MNTYDAGEALRRFVLTHGLPFTDMALVGMQCPYCGKFDRIRQLEPPGDLGGNLSDEERLSYSEYFDRLTHASDSLGVCKFCHYPVRLADGTRPEPLAREE